MANETIIHALDVEIKEQMPTIKKLHEIVEGTQNIYEVGFTFDAEWDNFSITVIFINGNVKKTYILGADERTVQIPRSIIFAGTLFIGAYGVNASQVITTQKPVGVAIKNAFGLPMQVEDRFTQTQYDLLMQELHEVRQLAAQSIVVGEQVAQNAFDVEQNAEQVSIDKQTVEQYMNDALASKNAAKTSETNAANSAVTAKANADIAQNLYDQLQPMNTDVSSKAPSIVSEAVGSVITLDDSSNMPLQSLTIYGKSVQDGTPTPEAPVEIVSVENPKFSLMGKNIFRLELEEITFNGVIISKVDDYFVLNGTATESANYFENFIYLPEGVYTISANNPAHNNNPYALIQAYSAVSGSSVTADDNKINSMQTSFLKSGHYACRIRIAKGVNYNNFIIKPQLEISKVATEYRPYKPPQSLTFPYTLRGIPVTFGGNYTDESGQQWICDTIEVNADGTGKLVQRIDEMNLKDSAGIALWTNEEYKYGTPFTINLDKTADYSRCDWCMCNRFEITDLAGTEQPSNTIRVRNYGLAAWLVTDVAATTDELKEWLNNNETLFQYVLATPIETDLTAEEVQAFLALHTNKPYSTIFNSAGADQKIEYVADTKLYIDKKIKELAST